MLQKVQPTSEMSYLKYYLFLIETLLLGAILDFRSLFPYVNVSGGSLTIITIHEKQNPVILGSDLVDSGLNRINLIEQVII